ncbi:MAG TPA: carbonic anhydrase [Candidatus Eremiobacteraeota bacterium]|mgnify:FL=1|nr:carbonic anhydrase [Candidatus Eremiobacteraeota bacterium]
MITSDEALKKLITGNKRFAERNMQHPNQTEERQNEIIAGQKPFAIILSCSDSRIPPEIVFDQGLGDLFVIRVAGNILDNIIKGSIEYAVDHLKVKLVMVLGHSNCGALKAAISGGRVSMNISQIIDSLLPSVTKARELKGDIHENATKLNILRAVEQLMASPPVLDTLVKKGQLKIVGAYYNLETGLVEILKHI